jgi:peroxiredoxin Q/BCP
VTHFAGRAHLGAACDIQEEPAHRRQEDAMHPTLHLTIALALVLGLPLVARAADLPKVGDHAPDFTLSSQDGTPVQLGKLRGQWVVLYFYPKDMTPGCSVEARGFQRDQAQYAARKAVVLGVSVDSVESHKKFCTKEGLNFELLADTQKKVADAYGSLSNYLVIKVASRHTFIIDPAGRIARIFTDVKPAVHSREVLEALDALAEAAPKKAKPGA